MTKTIEQLQARVAELEAAHAAVVLSNVQLRDAIFDMAGEEPAYSWKKAKEVESTPISTEALDKYVAEKVRLIANS